MYDFSYERPDSIESAIALLANDDMAMPIAGGMTLLPALKLRMAQASCLVDLAAITELRGIVADDRSVTIGAMTTHADVADDGPVRDRLPALADLAAGIGDPQVRNRGTIGGSLANNDPAADYPAAVLGLGATIVTTRREISAEDYFLGMFTTALEPGEIITQVRFPLASRAAYAKFRHPASGYAVVGVFVSESDLGIRVAVTGAGGCVFRHTAMEAALNRDFAPDALEGVGTDAADLNSDMHASAAYRAHLVGVMARRAVASVP